MGRAAQILLLVLAPVAVLAAMVAADRAFGAPGLGRDYVIRIALPPSGGEIGLPPVQGPLDASRPLVVIDAGHGGHDPGAGMADTREKTLTLALAMALRDRLLAEGGIRVALTRSDDHYLLLEERSGIARRLKADLFVSIHADSTGEGVGDASGATIYTLSETGSSQTAERMAARENGSDTVNGVSLKGKTDAVSAILVDLSQRDTQARSNAFASVLLREAQGSIPFREHPVQSAAFVVLKSPDVPSVLFEAGYISNPAEAARLLSAAGRDVFAQVTAQAIRVHFARISHSELSSAAPITAPITAPGGV